jgi:hypothetical protein
VSASRRIRRAGQWVAGGVGLAAAAYAIYVGITWYRFGQRARSTAPGEADALLDRFMPEYDVAERHHVGVAAPAEITLSAAADMDLQHSTIIRGIFKARELVLGAHPDTTVRPRGLLAEMTSLGWGVLADVPGRQIVVGSVTQPWLPDVVFRALSPEEFAGFREPGYVKIVWTLRADPSGPSESIFRTETRAVTTDPTSRAKFRWYWSFVSPGIWLIRRLSLAPLRTEAERRAHYARRIADTAPRAGRRISLLSSRNHSTVLATAAHRSQSSAVKL